MNFGVITNEVGQNMTSSDPTRVKMWVNAAYHEILASSRWSFLEVTTAAIALVASQQAYVLVGTSAVVTDFAGIIDVRMELTSAGARKKLKNLTQQDFDDVSDHSRVNGAPAFYTIVGGALPTAGSANILSGAKQELLLWPIPIATAGNGVNLFLRYFRSVDSCEMSADSDVPIIPVQHHYAIIELAKAIGLADDDQTQQAQQFRDMAEKRIQKMLVEDMAARSGDNQVYQLKALPSLPDQAPLTQRDFDPNTRPYAQSD